MGIKNRMNKQLSMIGELLIGINIRIANILQRIECIEEHITERDINYTKEFKLEIDTKASEKKSDEQTKKPSTRWSDDETYSLIGALKDGATYAEIAEETGRSVRSVKSKALQIDIDTDNAWEPRVFTNGRWTDEDDSKLINLVRDGRTNREIADTLQRKYRSITSRIYILKKQGRIASQQ